MVHFDSGGSSDKDFTPKRHHQAKYTQNIEIQNGHINQLLMLTCEEHVAENFICSWLCDLDDNNKIITIILYEQLVWRYTLV